MSVSFLLALLPALSQAQIAPVAGRPILFVHGICGTACDWDELALNIIEAAANTGLYPTNAGILNGGLPYKLNWDGGAFLWPSNAVSTWYAAADPDISAFFFH